MNVKREFFYILIICLFFTLANDRDCWSRQNGKPVRLRSINICPKHILQVRIEYKIKGIDKDDLFKDIDILGDGKSKLHTLLQAKAGPMLNLCQKTH